MNHVFKHPSYYKELAKVKKEFEENNIQGHGTYNWADGRMFVGSWVNNKMEG